MAKKIQVDFVSNVYSVNTDPDTENGRRKGKNLSTIADAVLRRTNDSSTTPIVLSNLWQSIAAIGETTNCKDGNESSLTVSQKTVADVVGFFNHTLDTYQIEDGKTPTGVIVKVYNIGNIRNANAPVAVEPVDVAPVDDPIDAFKTKAEVQAFILSVGSMSIDLMGKMFAAEKLDDLKEIAKLHRDEVAAANQPKVKAADLPAPFDFCLIDAVDANANGFRLVGTIPHGENGKYAIDKMLTRYFSLRDGMSLNPVTIAPAEPAV